MRMPFPHRSPGQVAFRATALAAAGALTITGLAMPAVATDTPAVEAAVQEVSADSTDPSLRTTDTPMAKARRTGERVEVVDARTEDVDHVGKPRRDDVRRVFLLSSTCASRGRLGAG